MRNRGKYAAIGFVVSKLAVPLAKRQVKRAARAKVKGAAGAARRSPAKLSVAIGAAAGAAGWLLSKRRATDSEPADEG